MTGMQILISVKPYLGIFVRTFFEKTQFIIIPTCFLVCLGVDFYKDQKSIEKTIHGNRR